MQSPIFAGIAGLIGPGELANTNTHPRAGLAVIGIALCVGLLLVIQPRFWKTILAPAQPQAGETRPIMAIPRRRLIAIYALMLFILGGSFLDMARDSEHWPWSCYPMYSEIQTGTTFDDYRLYGVPKENPSTEISLFTDERYLQPFDQSRLALVLDEVHDDPGLHHGLQNCLTRYEALRKGGRHPGPELSAIRMYKVYWTLDPYGATIEKPDRKVLVDEVTAPANEKS